MTLQRLNLSNIKRDIDEEDEYSEEDFENKATRLQESF